MKWSYWICTIAIASLTLAACGGGDRGPECNNGILEDGEACDTSAFGEQTCETLGHDRGELACTDTCTVDESACIDLATVTFGIFDRGSDGATDTPLEGATVAFDAPDGTRTEKVTGADGKVSFEEIDWSQGTAAVTAHQDGYALSSMVNLDADQVAQAFSVDDAVVMSLFSTWEDVPETVTVSGTATGLQDPAHGFVVNVLQSQVGTEWSGTGGQTYMVTAPRDEPFMLQALEMDSEQAPSGQGYSLTLYQVMQLAIDPTSDDVADLTLDFATSEVSTQTADAWFALPARAGSPLRTGSPICLVCERNSLYCIGWAQQVDISADGEQFDVSFIWTTPAWAGASVFTMCYVYKVEAMVQHGPSAIMPSGYPEAGELDPLLDLPRWVAPADPTNDQPPIHDALQWELFDQGTRALLNVYGRDGQLRWKVNAGLNTTSATIPQPPSTVDRETFLGNQSLKTLLTAADLDEADWYALSYAQAQQVFLQP